MHTQQFMTLFSSFVWDPETKLCLVVHSYFRILQFFNTFLAAVAALEVQMLVSVCVSHLLQLY